MNTICNPDEWLIATEVAPQDESIEKGETQLIEFE